eukprot:2035539-Karenia_brevis.AAC.1
MDAAQELFDTRESQLELAPYNGAEPWAQQELTILVNHFANAKSATLVYLELKCNYVLRLPVLLCALAHVDEEDAR